MNGWPDEGPSPEKLREALDKLAIDELHTRYTFALNWQDADGVAELFAEDGVLDWVGGAIEGREAIRSEVARMHDWFGKFEAADAPLRPARLRHFVTNKLIEIDGDRARSLGYWLELNNDNRLRWPYVGAYGHYEDSFVRTAQGWRIARRTIFNEQVENREGPATNPAF